MADGIDHRGDDSAQARIEILKRELATSRELMARAREGLGSSRARNAELSEIIAGLSGQVAELEAAQASLAEHAGQLSEDNEALREEITRISQAFGAEIQRRAVELDGLHRQLIAVYASTSWRVTRPLRFAVRKLRAIRPWIRQTLHDYSPRQIRKRLRWKRQYAAVQRSGLFDEAYYRASYPDVAETGIDPLTHYLSDGWREARRPGPGFDTDYYNWANPDLAKAGMEALTHYALHGKREGREMRAVGQWRPPAKGFGPMRETAPILPPPEPGPEDEALWAPRIAVSVHAFYPDVFAELCPRLAEIPGRYSLLVSTPNAPAKAAVEAAIAAHGLNADPDVRVTQNRGRNFGPMFAEFSGAILEHDLLLHIHTKKSLHNHAGEQTAWRDDIFAGLIGEGGVASSVVALFGARPEIGLVFTRTFKYMAYWANHWLQNTGQARALFARLGVPDYSLRGYIDYPVGGMFWARVEAIAPMLRAGFTYEDFPPEAGQLDGTIAHAIERGFTDVARSRGYTFAEADPEENLFRLGWSDKNLERYELNNPRRLRAMIDKTDLVSFDLFDTLMQRPSLSPDAVQRHAGLLLAAEHPGAPDFFTARKAAEHAARAAKNFEGDVGLDAIYAQMRGAGWDETALQRARALEIEIEQKIVLTRPPLIEGARYAREKGKRVVAISDTYFNPAEIGALLDSAGLSGLFDEIYLSSELGARKDRGDLWTLLKSREKAPPSRWLHIGDNEVSDMQRAGDIGMWVFHAMNPATLLMQKGFLSAHTVQAADEAEGWTDALLLGPAVARLAADPFPTGGALGPARVETAHDLGYCVFGPALFAFCAWLAARPETRELDRLYFLSREGWALQPVYDRVRAALNNTPPPSSYLHISRRTVLLAAQAGGFDPTAVIEGPEFIGDYAGLLKARLGFTIPAGSAVDGAAGLKLPMDADVARAALETLREPVEAQAKEEARALGAYLTQQGLARARAGVVDVGYRATIQKGLQAALGKGLAGFYMATFPEAAGVGEAQTDGTAGSALGYFGDQADPLGDDPIIRQAILLEAFLTAPQGQVDHFVTGADGAAGPVFQPATRSEEDLATLEQLHAGAFAYADDLIRWYGPAVAGLAFNPAAALDPLIAFGTGRLIAPAEVLKALRVDDAFCGFEEEHQVGLKLAQAE